MMKYGLIGCGRIAYRHIEAAKENNLEIVALCDLIPDKMEQIAKEHQLTNVRMYTDYNDMLNEMDFDLVAIATESGTHPQIALAAIEHKINVLIEKPIALSISDADQIIRKAKEHHVLASVCFQNRFNKPIRELKKAIDTGRFGTLSHGSLVVRWSRDHSYFEQASWRGTWECDGGTLMNQCIHGIDLLIWLMNSRPVKVYGQTRNRIHPYIEAEDIGMAIISFENGSIATIEGTSNVYPTDLEEIVSIFGQNGTVKIGGLATNKTLEWNFHDSIPMPVNDEVENVYGNGHISLYRDVKQALANGTSPGISANDGKAALEMILAIYKSQLTGQVITLPLEDFSTLDMKST